MRDIGPGGNGAGGPSGGVEHEVAVPPDLPVVLGRNLKRLRTRQGYSLDRLAELSGVSRAMIGQIETAKSVPTISLLSRVAKALDVEFASLLSTQIVRSGVILRADQARQFESSGGKYKSRPLLPLEPGRAIAFEEVRLASRHNEDFAPHSPGTRKHLVLAHGALTVVCRGKAFALSEGDALQFDADAAHVYRNTGNVEAIVYIVTTSADRLR
jgi:transcriptional regulator with XRE-family HTH domain